MPLPALRTVDAKDRVNWLAHREGRDEVVGVLLGGETVTNKPKQSARGAAEGTKVPAQRLCGSVAPQEVNVLLVTTYLWPLFSRNFKSIS